MLTPPEASRISLLRPIFRHQNDLRLAEPLFAKTTLARIFQTFSAKAKLTIDIELAPFR
jgi:hypothetical protein